MSAGNADSARGRVRRRALAFVAVVTASCLALTACGGSGSSGGKGGSAGGTSVSQAKLAALKAKVEKAKQVPKFVPPAPKVDVSAVKGKTVYTFPINNEIDTCNHQVKTYVGLAKEFGMKVINFHDSGKPTEWATGVKNAISAHADVLAMFCGIIPGAVGPQLQSAHKAGIKIIDGNYNETNNYKGLDAETAVQTAEGMARSVDAAVVRLNGKPLHALMVTSSSVIQGPAAEAAVKNEVKADCPKVCAVDKVVNVAVQDWTSKTEGQVSSALLADPKINAVFVAFDGMSLFAVTGVQQAKRTDVKVYTWGASASVMKTMVDKPDGILQANVGPTPAWDAYAEMDQTIRLLAGQQPAPVEKEIVPNRFFAPDNAAKFLTPSGGYSIQGFGGKAFENGYRKLWGAPHV